MKITDVIVRKFYRIGKMRAIVSVTLDDIFVIHDIKVIQGQNGLFIAMPSRKMVDGVYKDICHPIDSETRALFQQKILEAYKAALAEETALSESRKDYDGYLKDSLDSEALE